MAKIIVKSKYKAGQTWLVDYVEELACGCGYKPRTTVKIIQEKEPSEIQIYNAINKSKRENV